MSGTKKTTELEVNNTRDRFDMEQEILECWRVTNDIELFMSQGADKEKMKVLSEYYDQKFERLWETFEMLTRKGKIL